MHDPLNMSVQSRMGVWEKKVDESEREKNHIKSEQVHHIIHDLPYPLRLPDTRKDP